ncbi:39S ribosomal protein L40, mitochondrial isoform X2 [Venturia canescens]|uniref:39S ribosomal protein L40, mitochondrial isoform X2 n=1 Tax=Venturia canescens TaxID=32260 RepID=UPI001C9C54C0|nr:39S ribosomal protein L40, mitochondrial isoform X2 [Venturia canescens]
MYTDTRLTLHNIRTTVRRNISTNVNPLCFRATAALFAEPLKKKRRLDPAIIRAREERRKRKLEKAIRRLEKNAKQLKPIADLEIPFKLIDERATRIRNLPPVSQAVQEDRILTGKEWTRYKLKQRMADLQMLDTISLSQQKALDELRAESEELYMQAIQVDNAMVPLTIVGPKNTPSIMHYDSPDGEYVDVTKKFEGE